jgi:hypothetical protein
VNRIVADVLAAVDRQGWAALKMLLHPCLHWAEPRTQIRGRTKVFARLAASPKSRPPDTYELRGGQIYRWTSSAAVDRP